MGWEDHRPLGQTQNHRPALTTASSGLGLSSLVAKVRPDQGCDLHCKEVWFLEGTPVAKAHTSVREMFCGFGGSTTLGPLS